jgi:hypothetical protein
MLTHDARTTDGPASAEAGPPVVRVFGYLPITVLELPENGPLPMALTARTANR